MKGLTNLTMDNPLCTQKNLDELQASAQRFYAILNQTSSSAEDIPCDNQHSWLRSYYSSLRKFEYCGDQKNGIPLKAEFQQLTKDTDRIIRLIDFREIYSNFREYYKSDFEKLKTLEQTCGISVPDMGAEFKCTAPPEQNPNKEKITRAQLFAFANQLGSSSCTQTTDSTPEDDCRLRALARDPSSIQ